MPELYADADPFFKIDIHTHILPKNIPNYKDQFGYGGFITLDHIKPDCANMIVDGKFFREIKSNCWDSKVRLKELDQFNINIQVLSTVPVMFNYWAKPEHTLIVSQYINDDIANLVENNPTRFVGLGTLPMQDHDLAIQELDRCMNDLGLLGIEIGTHINDWNLDDKHLFPIFQEAEKLGASILIHPWDMMGKNKMSKYWLPWLVGMPAETSLAICSMIFGGVFEKLPKLRVAFAHGGGSFPATIGRIEHGFKVRPDLVAVDNNVNPRHYLGKFYLDSLVHEPLALEYLINLVGAENIALGTDYPFPLGELVPGSLIESMKNLSRETKQRLFAGTAMKWLNLDKKRFEV